MTDDTCSCGCGRDVPPSTRGEARKFSSNACKQRAYRNTRQHNTVTNVATGDIAPICHVKPILKYPGAKWSRARWIVAHFPAHRTYVEPYLGSAAVFFSKPLAEYNVLNDKSEQVVNFFRVVRTQGEEFVRLARYTPWSRAEYEASYHLTGDALEDARRFLVRCWQAHGTRLNTKTGWRNRGSADGGHTVELWRQVPGRIEAAIQHLQQAEIECRPALEVVKRFSDDPDTLLYVDPPYVLSTRQGAMYEHEMSDSDHTALLEALNACAGSVVLSVYAHPLYDRMLPGWQRVESLAYAEKGKTRTEVLWLNPRAAGVQQRSLFGGEAS